MDFLIHQTKQGETLSLPLFLFKLTFLSLGSLFVLHISGKRRIACVHLVECLAYHLHILTVCSIL